VDLGRLRSPTFWRDFHDLVAKQVARIGDVIGGLSEASAAPQQVNPAEVVAAVVAQNKSALSSVGVALTCDCPDLPSLQIDAGRFQKLFEMLLRIDLAPEVQAHNAALAVKATDGGIHIGFRNDGPGIPAEALRAVFDPFFIRADGAHESGLSLMAVFFLVHHLGGRISSLSGAGQGLQIALEIPASPPAAAGADSRSFITSVLMNDSLWERLLPQ
jgi:signal transduction histidine kinase